MGGAELQINKDRNENEDDSERRCLCHQ